MKLNLIPLIKSNIFLKIASTIIAFALWSHLSVHRVYTKTFSVPLYFYGSRNHDFKSAPEMVMITLSGTRQDIKAINQQALAIHVNSDQLQEGNNNWLLHEADLLLPPTIKLLHYVPNTLIITKQLLT